MKIGGKLGEHWVKIATNSSNGIVEIFYADRISFQLFRFETYENILIRNLEITSKA